MTTTESKAQIQLYETNGGTLFLVDRSRSVAVSGLEWTPEVTFDELAASWGDDWDEHDASDEQVYDVEDGKLIQRHPPKYMTHDGGRHEPHTLALDEITYVASYDGNSIERHTRGGSAAQICMGDKDA